MNQLGNKIASQRKNLGMTQTEMAEKLSVTRQTVSRWEAGSVLPDIDKIADIASLLQVSCDYLLKDEIEKETDLPAGRISSRLLEQVKGKKVRLTFFDEEADIDLFNTDCTVIDFEGNWMKAAAETRKGTIEKLIPLSSVCAIEFREDD